MKKIAILLGTLIAMNFSYSQNCIDVGITLDRELNQLIFSNVMLAGERFLAIDGGGNNGYQIAEFKQFRVCNGWYRYSNIVGGIPCDGYGGGAAYDGTFWRVDINRGKIDHYDLMVKNKRVDSKGFPISIPMTMPSADSTFSLTIYSLYRKINLPPVYPQGDVTLPWVLRFKGKGQVEMGDVLTDVFKRTSNVHKVTGSYTWESDGGSVRMEISLKGGIKSFNFQIFTSDPADPIRDVELLFPGTETLVDAGNNINPEFMDKMKNFKVIRFKECLGATSYKERGGSETDPTYKYYIKRVDWKERITPGYYWQNGRRGLALDYVIEICNQAKINPWVCIPYCASPEFCSEAAKLFMQKLSPDLIANFELGDNLMFWTTANGDMGANNGFYFMAEMGKTYYGGLGQIEATGYYMNDIFQAMGDGAGPANAGRRLKRIASTWGQYYDVNNRHLGCIKPGNWEYMPDTWGLAWEGANETCNGDPNFRQQLVDYWTAHPGDQEGFNALFLKVLRNNFKYCYDKWSINNSLAIMYGKQLVLRQGGMGIMRRPSVGGCWPCANGPNGTPLPGGECDCNNQWAGKNCFDWSYQVGSYPSANPLLNAFFAADSSWAVEKFLSDVFDTMQAIGTAMVCYGRLAADPTCSGDGGLIYSRDLFKPYDTLYYRNGRFRAIVDRKQTANCDLAYQVAVNKRGPGQAVRLDGVDDHIVIDKVAYLPNETVNYTIEGWFVPGYVGGADQHIISLTTPGSDINYNIIKIKKDGKINWSIGDNLGEYLNLSGPVAVAGKWSHVAVTKSLLRYTLYVNGVNVASMNIAMKRMSRSIFSIGATVFNAGTNGYALADIDEVRLWNIARSITDIRDFMCKKTTKTNITTWANLKICYRFDQVDMANNSVYNLTTNAWEGTFKNVGYNRLSGYCTSGAPIGDYSGNRYTSNWSGVAVTLTHPLGDALAVNNLGEGSPEGVQIYYSDSTAWNNDMPDYYDGISTDRYWGVFMANGTDPSFDVTYNYQGHPQAKTGAEGTMNRMLRRANSADTIWVNSGAKLNLIVPNLFLGCREKYRGEYTLGFRKDSTRNRPGSGKALRFVHPTHAGGDGVTHGAHFYVDLQDFTISFWGKGSMGYIFSMRSFSQGVPSMEYSFGNGSFGVRWNHGDWTPDGLTNDRYQGITDWVHYCVVRKGQSLTFYVNGYTDANYTKSFGEDYIVRRFDLCDPPYFAGGDGTIDEFAVFNTAMDSKTIRDYMCKKIDGGHPYSCKNLVMYFNFDEGQGNVLEDKYGGNDLVFNSNMPVFSWVTSGAAIGNVSAYNYTSPFTTVLTHLNGDHLDATTSNTPDGVHLYRIDNYPPIGSVVDSPAIKSIDSSRYWGIYTVKQPSAVTNFSVTDYYEKNGQVILGNESQLRMLTRANNADTLIWHANMSTLPNTTAHTLTLTGQTRKEYMLGGTQPTTFAAYIAPLLPVFSPESPTLNKKTICGNETNLTYGVINDPTVSYYKWTLPVGLDGYATINTITINANYSGKTQIQYTIKVEAINPYGTSPAATYVVTVNPPPTLADAGPDILIFPPTNTAKMDGNVVVSGETALWQKVSGVGTLTNSADPKTTVTAIGNGTSKYFYTITGAGCPPSIDSMNIVLGPPPTGVVMYDDSPLPTRVCEGVTWNVKALPPNGLTPTGYQWIMPSGMKLITNTGIYATIYMGSGFGGSIGVQAVYSGALSDTFLTEQIAINPKPNDPVLVQKPSAVCWNFHYNYECALDATIDSFAWELPYGIYPTVFPKSTGNLINVNILAPTATGYIKVKAYKGGCTMLSAIDSVFITTDTTPPPASMSGTPFNNMGPDGNMCYTKQVFFVKQDDSVSTYNWKILNNYTQDPANVIFIEYLKDDHSAVLYDFTPYSTNRIEVHVSRIRGTGTCNESVDLNKGTWVRWGTAETFPTSPIVMYDSVITAPYLNLVKGGTYKFRTGGGIGFTNRSFLWLAPKGVTIIPYANPYADSVKIRIDSNFAGYLEVYGLSYWGCTQGKARIAIGSGGVPLPPEYISGATSYCVGDVFGITVDNVAADDYTWTLPNGTIYITLTNVLTETASVAIKGDMTVVARRGTKFSTPVKINVIVRASTLPPLTFLDKDGPITFFQVCRNTNKVLFVKDAGADSIRWTRVGGLIEGSGSTPGTNFITHDTASYWQGGPWYGNQNPGYLRVTAYNSCGTNRVDSIYYDLATPPDFQVPVFDNPQTALCVGSNVTFKIVPLKNMDRYRWSLPPGLNATALETTAPEITVQVSAGTGGIIEVYGISILCGGGNTQVGKSPTLSISGVPVEIEWVRSPLAACGNGDTLTYSIKPLPGVTQYYWSVPASFSQKIIDDLDATPGKVTITGGWNLTNTLLAPTYNNGYRRTQNSNTGRVFQFVEDLPYAGRYKVELYWINYFDYAWDNSTHTPVTIIHKNGKTDLLIDQNINKGHCFHYIGTFEFNKGTSDTVQIRTNGVPGDNYWSVADAIRYTLDTLIGDTVQSFVVTSAGALPAGGVCVTVKTAQCPTGFSTCTSPINTTGILGSPTINIAPSGVCAGQFYTYVSSDIGAGSYNWILPKGMSINGNTGTVMNQGLSVDVRIDTILIAPVKIGVYGFINDSCNVPSDTAYSTDITMSTLTCPLADPVFDRVYDSLCTGSVKVFSILQTPGAEQYEWTLPDGITQVESGKSGVILTTVPQIILSIDKTGLIPSIMVKAISSKQPSSISMPTGSIMSIDATPSITIAPQATCPGDTGVVMINENPLFVYSTNITGAASIDSTSKDSLVVVWGSVPSGTVSVTANKPSIFGCSVSRNFPIDLSGGETTLTCPPSILETVNFDTLQLTYNYILKDTLKPVVNTICGYRRLTNSYDSARNEIFDTIAIPVLPNQKNPEDSIVWTLVKKSGESISCTFKITLNINMDLAPYTAFSPNSDGVNDKWNVGNISYYPGSVVKVFDRWGQLVFECKTGCDLNLWDGRDLKGNMLPFETYHFMITQNNRTLKVGYVTLIR